MSSATTGFLAVIFAATLITGFMLRARPELGLVFARELKGGRRCGGAQRNPSTTLKTISSAQADFRANDRDGDGVNQFWRSDIAGLYTIAPSSGDAIKLIELSTAAADDRPVTNIARHTLSAPKAGYWYRAIRHADELDLDPSSRFAACAYPDTPASGKWTFIVDENNTIFRKELGPHQRGVEVFPADLAKEGWTKLD